MARRIYIVELEIEASDENGVGEKVEYGAFLPSDERFTEAILRAMQGHTVRLGFPWMVEAAEVIGKREG